MQNFINKDFVYAVIGVSADEIKYGTRVFRTILDLGYNVYGINPKHKRLFGQTIYPSLDKLPNRPDVVVLVVPPQVGETIIEQMHELRLKKAWFQPGAGSDQIVKLCEKYKIDCVPDACIIIDGMHTHFLY